MAGFGTLKVKVAASFVLVFLVLPLMADSRSYLSDQQKLDIRSHLNRINKTPVKSIESPDGDIIDCIHISEQPAFDHPLLKDHKIQMRPSGILTDDSSKKPITQLWHFNGECPKGTIPVRRITEEDLLRSSSLETFGRKKNLTYYPSGHEHAGVAVEGETYHGAKATINLWEPFIERPTDFSLSQLWVLAGSYASNDLNSIEVGWQIYGDYRTRLFIYWTRDAYTNTGCYNMDCPGFIQTSSEIVIGGTISPVSIYGGPQYNITLLVMKDLQEDKWWLYVDDKIVGYWPSSLFTHLADNATMINWGGEIFTSQPDGPHTSTEMGSGHFPNEGFGKSSYFRNIQVVDESNNLKIPTNFRTFAEKPNCYDVQLSKDDDGAPSFFYGGPGRNLNCL